ncbi:hypothetical protein EYZ11_002989 [Aspergillus tanneri]|uniref:Uncharacterized protein n=1 Tax=Aspergillus tanneri TaxID=1220188 RepID=A0A4S3JPB8_9EURO|nr:hypothetical protein EYZ11_002989 [Aspergillus tanneri]
MVSLAEQTLQIPKAISKYSHTNSKYAKDEDLILVWAPNGLTQATQVTAIYS